MQNQGVRVECSEEWRSLKAFADAQWEPSLKAALLQRAVDAAEDAAEQGRFADQTANQGTNWNQQVLKGESAATAAATTGATATPTSAAPAATVQTSNDDSNLSVAGVGVVASKEVSGTGIAWGARPGQSDGFWVSPRGEVVIAASGAGAVVAAQEVLSVPSPSPAPPLSTTQAVPLQPESSSSSLLGSPPATQAAVGGSSSEDDEVDAWTLEERKRMAQWSTEGWQGRPTLSNFLWTFAYLKAVADKWDADVAADHASEALPTAPQRQEKKKG